MRDFYDLGTGDELAEPAIALSKLRQVIVRPVTADATDELVRHGFVPVASGFHVIASPRTLTRHRSRRRQLRVQCAALERSHLDVTVVAGRSLGAVEDDLYRSLVAPWAYGRGAFPHGIHRLAEFRRIVHKSVVVTATDQDARYRAVSVYRVRRGADLRVTAAAVAPDHLAVGVVEVVDPELAGLRRAWRHCAVEAMAQVGVDAVSLGADDCLIDPAYIPVIHDKVSWYKTVGWETEPRPRLVSMRTAVRRPDRFPLALGSSPGGLEFIGGWDAGPAAALRQKIEILMGTRAEDR